MNKPETLQKLIAQMSHNTLVAEVTANVIEDLYDSLAVIKGNMDVIMGALHGLDVDVSVSTSLSRHNASLNKGLEIINNLREYIQDDGPCTEELDIHKIIIDSVSVFRGLYNMDNLEIDLKFDCMNLPANGNKSRLKRLFINIFYIAARSMRSSGGGKISILTFTKASSLVLKICDTGAGYRPSELEMQKARWLSFSAPVLKGMDAALDVESRIGTGTCYTIEFPVLIRDAGYAGFERTALVVDDEPEICEILTEYLESCGISVDIACNGQAALQKIKPDKYDFIITDIKMPVMCGERFIDEMSRKNLHGKSKIIMITGCMIMDKSTSYMEILRNKADGFIQKPFSREIILKTISELESLSEMAH